MSIKSELKSTEYHYLVHISRTKKMAASVMFTKKRSIYYVDVKIGIWRTEFYCYTEPRQESAKDFLDEALKEFTTK